MKCLEVFTSKTAYPTGSPDFAVIQPFPAAVSAEKADPFLMCDEFGPEVSKGKETDPDAFSVDWHPHVGMDIMTYMKQGVGRHADSLGNRLEFQSPGFQWCSVGSGIVHAEGGGTPKGESQHGFQIWINVPKAKKNDDPRYGTENPENIPVLEFPGVLARLLAGDIGEQSGPFQTAQPVHMVDFELDPGAEFLHSIPAELDNCLVYVYNGSGLISGEKVKTKQVALLDAQGASKDFTLTAGAEGMHAMLFAGKRIKEPIFWRGPFVASDKAGLAAAFKEYQSGNFPKVRVPYDFMKASEAPQ